MVRGKISGCESAENYHKLLEHGENAGKNFYARDYYGSSLYSGDPRPFMWSIILPLICG